MNFESLNNFLLFKTNRNNFKNLGTVLGPVRPRATAHGGAAACHKQCPDSCLGFGLPARPTSQSGRTCLLGAARRARVWCGHAPARAPGHCGLADGLGVAAVVASAPMEQRGEGGRRARRSGVELTRAAARRGDGGG
jgi:hypothetical protein